MMTQAIINNAAAISLDRDLTVAITTSQSRRTKYFRKGPIQTTARVDINVIRRSVYQPILSAISNNLLGPYTITFPSEVVGNAATGTIRVNGASQSGSSISVRGNASSTIASAGTFVKFPSVAGSYVLTQDCTTNSSGVGNMSLDYPIPTSPTDSETVQTGSNIQFSMILSERPRASFGPTGLVAHDGPFEFVENL